MRSKARVRVKPKRYFCDPSLAAALLGATPDRLIRDTQTLGMLFKSLVLLVYARANGMRLYHYHNKTNLEAGAAVASPGGWAPVGVKLCPAQVGDAAKSLLAVERRVTSAGSRPPLAKLVVVGFGTPASTCVRSGAYPRAVPKTRGQRRPSNRPPASHGAGGRNVLLTHLARDGRLGVPEDGAPKRLGDRFGRRDGPRAGARLQRGIT